MRKITKIAFLMILWFLYQSQRLVNRQSHVTKFGSVAAGQMEWLTDKKVSEEAFFYDNFIVSKKTKDKLIE